MNIVVLNMMLLISPALSALSYQPRISSWKRRITYGLAAFERMSSVPASRSSRNPKVSALASRFAFQYGTAMLRMLVKIAIPATTNTVSAIPARQSSLSSRTRMPASSTTLPSISKMNSEKNLPSSFGSPSTRSIISPGVRSLWYDMSSDRACPARSSRILFVAVQPTRSEK